MQVYSLFIATPGVFSAYWTGPLLSVTSPPFPSFCSTSCHAAQKRNTFYFKLQLYTTNNTVEYKSWISEIEVLSASPPDKTQGCGPVEGFAAQIKEFFRHLRGYILTPINWSETWEVSCAQETRWKRTRSYWTKLYNHKRTAQSSFYWQQPKSNKESCIKSSPFCNSFILSRADIFKT